MEQRNDLYKLANRLPGERFEVAFEGCYADTGRPAKAIGQMVGLPLVKQLKNVSDKMVCRLRSENLDVQYFCGEELFQWGQPCNPSDLVHFRNWIYERGVEDLLKATVYLHRGKTVSENDFSSVLVDRGYQGKSEVSGMEIYALHRGKKTGSYYWQRKDRLRFAPSGAVDPVFGHLKNDFRMARCSFKGALGASQNLMLAAASWNLKKWINESSFCLNFARLFRTLVDALLARLDLNHQSQCLSGGF